MKLSELKQIALDLKNWTPNAEKDGSSDYGEALVVLAYKRQFLNYDKIIKMIELLEEAKPLVKEPFRYIKEMPAFEDWLSKFEKEFGE